MEKTTFIAGFSNLSDAFLSCFRDSGRRVIWTCEKRDGALANDDALLWNVRSRISARAMALAVRNRVKSLNEAIFAFDAVAISAMRFDDKISALFSLLDGGVCGTACLSDELSRVFGKKLRVVFLLHENVGQRLSAEAEAAQSAFVSYAESLSRRSLEGDGTNVSLFCDGKPTVDEIAAPLLQFLDDAGRKSRYGWVGSDDDRTGLLRKIGAVFGKK